MRKWVFTALSLAVALSVGTGVSAATAEVSEKPDQQQQQQQQHRRHHPMKGGSIHQGMYMQLLAEKYAPETKAEWKQVFDERRRLFEQMRNLDENSRGSVRDKMKVLFEDRDGKMKAHMETVTQFTQAVETNDEKQIREILPKLLASEKQFNQALADMMKGKGKK